MLEVFSISATDRLEYGVFDDASHALDVAHRVFAEKFDPEAYRENPLVVCLVSHRRGRKSARLTRSDALIVGEMLVLRRTALETKVGKLIERDCDVLPVRSDDADLCLVVPRSRDALDEKRSSVLRLPSGQAFSVTRAVFDPIAIGEITVFRIVTVPSFVYVTGAMRDAWLSSGLGGIDFKREWHSET